MNKNIAIIGGANLGSTIQYQAFLTERDKHVDYFFYQSKCPDGTSKFIDCAIAPMEHLVGRIKNANFRSVGTIDILPIKTFR